ncbi:glycosyltransferase family 4 protein [Glycomyces sp. NPDC047010]|uniref:glycosyltransferase family 4 protein n=1 Tax=Glycomyces sp. NPDC047010 TaxID=3155023 RepID=UPI0033EF45A5
MSNPRPRIVMLVHNNVKGDSRVQKQARSVAALGWDVTLLGVSAGRRRFTGDLGGAKVELIPLEPGLHQRPHELRTSFPRDPLAYGNALKARWKDQHLQARRADLGAAKAEYKLYGHRLPAPRRALAWTTLQARRVGFKLDAKWTKLRVRHTDALLERRLLGTAPFDMAITKFWIKTMGDRAWRRLDPDLWRYELAFGKVIDKLEPDVIHANDFPVLGVGARAKLRALAKGRNVKLVWDAHEYLAGIKPWRPHPRWHPAQLAHQAEYAPYADAVVTVSAELGELLVRDFHLSEPPAVVLNAPGDPARAGHEHEFAVVDVKGRPGWPAAESDAAAEVPSLRGRCGIGHDVPLMVYSGAGAPQRGLDTMVEALPDLPGVHAAFIVPKPEGQYAMSLLARAAELGAADRVHLLPYVEHYQVVEHLAEADFGVIPIHHWPNHEIALITKFFEYAHARLPIVVSDVEAMGNTVRATGQGEVFTAEDTADFTRAARAVLADPGRYRKAYDGPVDLDAWTWERQAEVLAGVYRRLLGS